MKYKYTAIAGQTDIGGRTTRRPVVEVELSNGTHARTFLALIDSGADQITMPAAIAKVFGIDRNQSPKRTTMGISMEPSQGFVGQLTLRIQDQVESFTAPVVFIDSEFPSFWAGKASSIGTASRSNKTMILLRLHLRPTERQTQSRLIGGSMRSLNQFTRTALW
jgi:hypothetical protein